MNLCVKHVGGAKSERIHRPVRDFHRSDQRRIHRRFHSFGLFRVNHIRLDASRKAGLHESVLISKIIFRQSYEQSRSVVNAVAGDLLQDHVLFYTLSG